MKFSAKRIVSLIIIIVSVIGFKEMAKHFRNTDTVLGRISGLVNRDNYLTVTTKSMEIAKIEIQWQTEFNKIRTVFKDGNEKGKIGHEYGSNSFAVKYKQIEILETGHFKTNNWHSHDYIFNIEEHEDSYVINFLAQGPDELQSIDTIPKRN